MAGLPGELSLDETSLAGYADDVALWARGGSVALVRDELTLHAQTFAEFTRSRGLVLNAGKTQLMWTGRKPGDVGDLGVMVGGEMVAPAGGIELLGVHIDDRLSFSPHGSYVARAARQRANMVARLACHLPRGVYLNQLAKGLVVCKVAYAISAVSSPRLEVDGGSSSSKAATSAVLVTLNDVARSITGGRWADHIRTSDLLHRAGMASLNAMGVRAVAMECWKAAHSSDGPNGTKNPLGALLFASGNDRRTRAGNDGSLPHTGPLRFPADTFVCHAAKIWNSSAALRRAPTVGAATAVAKALGKNAPV